MTDSETYDKEKVLRLMVQLCLAGREARYFIEECTGREPKSQYLTVAVVSRSELNSGDWSWLDAFYKGLHSSPMIVGHKMAFSYGRVAVVLNKYETNESGRFYEHGERRLFDPKKQLLYKVIDEHAPGDPRHPRPDRQSARTDLDHTLAGMIHAYRNTGASLDDLVLMVYSYFIPCDVPCHHCAKLLRRYADETGYIVYIACTNDRKFTNRNDVQNVLNGKRITLIGQQEFQRALDEHLYACVSDHNTSDMLEEINEFLRLNSHLRQTTRNEANKIIKRQVKRFRGNEIRRKRIKDLIALTAEE